MANCIPEISADTILIYEKLTKTAIGETITYQDLAQVIRRTPNAGMIRTARKKAQSEDRIVFGTIRGVGIRRLAGNEVVTNSAATFSHIQRTAKREKARLSSVEFESLSKELKIKHSASAAALAVIHEIAAPKQIRALESKSSELQKLSMIQTIDAIRESEGGL